MSRWSKVVAFTENMACWTCARNVDGDADFRGARLHDGHCPDAAEFESRKHGNRLQFQGALGPIVKAETF